MRSWIVRRWLVAGNRWATNRIAAGDLDFDDVVHRTRSATKTLLDIWFPEGNKE